VSSIAIALTFAIVSPAVPARAASPEASEESYRELQSASGLDLSREWASYERGERSTSFPKYVDRRFRVRRDLGRGLVVAGAALVFASTFFFFFGFTEPKSTRVNYTIAGTGAGLGGALLIPGAVLLGVYARRLERLEAATDEIDYGLELAHRRGGMQLDDGGLGLHFAF
jgi:hypothetical protein